MSEATLSAAIAETFTNLRTAIDERRYEDVQRILEDQRRLFDGLNFKEPGSLDLLKEAQDLTNWALTMARLQHAHAERAFSEVSRRKQFDQDFHGLSSSLAELVNVKA